MPYARTMGKDRPGLFVFVLDQSSSMNDPWPQSPKHRKADALADVLNNTLDEIASRCVKGEGQLSDRCHIAMIGYAGTKAKSAWDGALAGKEIVPITEVSENPLQMKKVKEKVENGSGGLVEVEKDVAVWLKPVTGGGTPMREGLRKALEIVQQWLPSHPDSFPPVVIHVTDGDPTSGDPSPEAEAIRNLQTNDGNVLLVNIHIPDGAAITALFPDDVASLPNNLKSAPLLFNMSSIIPEAWLQIAQKEGFNVTAGSRLMILNSDAINVIRLINFVTVVGTLASTADK